MSKATSTPTTRVIDIIPVNDELDMLGVHMEELNSVVDLFVIVNRFKKFAHNTLALFVHEMSWESREKSLHEKLYDITWAPEAHESSLEMCVALKESGATTGDWIMYSDLDEISSKDEITALHGVNSDRKEDRSYRSEPEQNLKVLPQGKDLFRIPLTVYDDFVALSQPQLPAPLPPPIQERQQQQELISSPEPLPPAAPAKRRPIAAEVFKNFKEKDLTYYENWVRAANRTTAEIKMYKDTMENLWIDGGFKTRWLRDNVNFPLLNEACWYCTYC
ncbi:hypothetical protein BGZ47_011174 [Haplosporangium gracile]|nr:hypothetical protein BGZ47_011174 [Haplosporangium gracile]